MTSKTLFALFALTLAATGCRQKKASVLGSPPAAASGAYLFPPSEDGWQPREPLVADGKDDGTDSVRVVSPSLKQGSFEFEGQTLRIAFSEPMVGDEWLGAKAKPVDKALVRIVPAVEFQLRWASASDLEVSASSPFDPNVQYTLYVGELKARSERPLVGGWTAKFKATPAITIGGKTISYVPVPGEPKPIAVVPDEGSVVGTGATLAVIFDQPVDPGAVRPFVALQDGGQPAAFEVARLTGKKIDGVDVDPRYVVVLRPKASLRAGATYTVRAQPPKGAQQTGAQQTGTQPDDGTLERSFSVAERLSFRGPECSYGRGDAGCVVDGTNVHMSRDRSLRLAFNNPLAGSDKELTAKVRVEPPVQNFSVSSSSWDGTLFVHGTFRASVQYTLTVAGVRDTYGSSLAGPVTVRLAVLPEPAAVSMADGLVTLDDAKLRAFPVTSRNAQKLELLVQPVGRGDAGQFAEAAGKARRRVMPTGDGVAVVSVPVDAVQDKNVTTTVDLSPHVKGTALVGARVAETAFGAPRDAYPRGSEAASGPVALVSAPGTDALGIHTHRVGDELLVVVHGLLTGEPAAGATVELGTARGTTDGLGFARLRVGAAPAGGTVAQGERAETDRLLSAGDVLVVRHGGSAQMLPLGAEATDSAKLFPEWSHGQAPSPGDVRAVVMTDKGIYRPGTVVHAKVVLRVPEGANLVPLRGRTVRFRLVDPGSSDGPVAVVTTGDRGNAAADLTLDAGAKTGRWQLRVEDPNESGLVYDTSTVTVAEYEAPRFAVDTTLTDRGRTVQGRVQGRYLFGSPMDGANVTYTLSRRSASLTGVFVDAGLRFDRETHWNDDEAREAPPKSGEGQLSKAGEFAVDLPVACDGPMPCELTFEADVSDRSHRHVAARTSLVKHVASKYVGLRATERWVNVGQEVRFDVGVIDPKGKPVAGQAVKVSLRRVTWKREQRRGAGGELRDRWFQERIAAGECMVQSAMTLVSCAAPLPQAGAYEAVAEVEGRQGGSTYLYAWGAGDAASSEPERGRRVELALDKNRYAPGETAKVLARTPYAKSTALVTVEQGGLLSTKMVEVSGATFTFDVPLTASSAPHVHATLSLFPRGSAEAVDYRVGAVRIPVSTQNASLSVDVRAQQAAFEPGQEAQVTVDVKDGTTPVAGADVTLAVVDEGVLRMTNHHVPSPTSALRPGRMLAFRFQDSRQGLLELVERSHVAGDGDEGGGGATAQVRKNFVETALWMPNLVTDAQGRVVAKVKLPDNLTEFRMMAMVVDPKGLGGQAESSFRVTRPVLLEPVLPRFAHVGDTMELAAMVHNNQDRAVRLTVALGDRRVEVDVAKQGSARVPFPFTANRMGKETFTFSVQEGSKVWDKVERGFHVRAPSVPERPRVLGTFDGETTVQLALPEDLIVTDGSDVVVRAGEHLWPELGARVEYLLDYPHGCVEQTTSSTLPLVAAKDILPRIGVSRLSAGELDARIRVGLDRLKAMQTTYGGLAYWPGGTSPSLFGTAYAMRAVILAKKAGVEPPSGLLEGMKKYLKENLSTGGEPAEVRASVAQSLADLGDLPPSALDALWDTRDKQRLFGIASLALTFAQLPKQGDRVKDLADRLEKAVDDEGKISEAASSEDFHYYGSVTRTAAQVAMALGKVRPASRAVPLLLRRLAGGIEGYTTQATAFSLLALAQSLRDSPTDGVEVTASLDGQPLVEAPTALLGAREFRLPLGGLRGQKKTLTLRAKKGAAVAFVVEADFARPLASVLHRAARRTESGVNVHRVVTDPRGGSVDLSKVKAGDLLRVALLARLPVDLSNDRRGYLALTDRLPACFEPVDPDLATVASAPEMGDEHPLKRFAEESWYSASYIDLRDERVGIYFDETGTSAVASYLVRATTPGTFAMPPAFGELMYEGGSAGYSDAKTVVVQ